MTPHLLSHSDLLRLKRWNTPTIYNGWEQITRRDPPRDAFNLEETRDFMPQMGPMVGYAVTRRDRAEQHARTATQPERVERIPPLRRQRRRARRSSSCRTSTSRASSAPSGAK